MLLWYSSENGTGSPCPPYQGREQELFSMLNPEARTVSAGYSRNTPQLPQYPVSKPLRDTRVVKECGFSVSLVNTVCFYPFFPTRDHSELVCLVKIQIDNRKFAIKI